MKVFNIYFYDSETLSKCYILFINYKLELNQRCNNHWLIYKIHIYGTEMWYTGKIFYLKIHKMVIQHIKMIFLFVKLYSDFLQNQWFNVILAFYYINLQSSWFIPILLWIIHIMFLCVCILAIKMGHNASIRYINTIINKKWKSKHDN